MFCFFLHFYDSASDCTTVTLGDITLAPKWIELECLSRERLVAGKALLEEILDGLIDHAGDRFEDWEARMENSAAKPPRVRREPSRKMKEEMKILDREMLHRLTANWLDIPSMMKSLLRARRYAARRGARKLSRH